MTKFGNLKTHGYAVYFAGNTITETEQSGYERTVRYPKSVVCKAMKLAKDREFSELQYLLENARMMGEEACNMPTLKKVVNLENEYLFKEYA